MTKYRILIADDHEVVREGTRALLQREGDLIVCGTACNGLEAVAKATELQPDILILDLTMPEMDGVEVVRQLRRSAPQTRILVFSALQSENVIEELFRNGIKAYIGKGDDSQRLIEAVRSLIAGKPFFTPKISEILFQRFLTLDADESASPAQRKLSTREREIVRLVAGGASNKEVASRLGVSPRTVETHRATLMRKLRVGSVAELVRYAVRNGMVAP